MTVDTKINLGPQLNIMDLKYRVIVLFALKARNTVKL